MSAEANHGGEVEAPRILICDEESAVVKVQTLLLEQKGYCVVSSAGGDHALGLLQGDEGSFDLMVTDIINGRMNGLELTRKALAMAPDMPIIVYSAVMDLARIEALSLGAFDCMVKPCSCDVYWDKVRQAVECCGDP